MSEPTKQQIGDGQDNYGRAASQAGKAIKTAAKGAKTATEGAMAAGNAAAQTVKAGVKVGKATAEIAAGTAAGGPWGAIISAAWSMRHTLFKILISICLAVVFLVVAIISLPSIIFSTIFENDYDVSEGQSALVMAYDDLTNTVDNVISLAFELTLGRVDDIILGGGYDRTYSMNNLTYTSPTNSDYDMYYILAAYSASEMQQNTSPEGMRTKLSGAMDLMFPIKYTVKTAQRLVETLLGFVFEPFEYIVCTIMPFDDSSILKAFNIDLDAKYGEFDITYGEAIDFMADALEKTMNGG